MSANTETVTMRPRARKSFARSKRSNWENLSAEELVVVWYLSYVAAVEFAEALRIALRMYPDDEGLKRMAFGELKTRNFSLDDFRAAGDHHEFLAHFLKKHDMTGKMERSSASTPRATWPRAAR